MRVETIGNATLYLGNCLEILPTLPKVDAIVTDPPYGHGWAGIDSEASGGRNWKRRRAEKIVGHDKPFDPSPFLALDVTCVFWGANHYADRLPSSPAWLAWDKREGTTENNLSDCELAWCNTGGSARLFRHMWNGLCRASEVGEHLHPTQKPVALMAWCIEKAKVKPASLILDPYMGSGTTGVAAMNAGHRFIGVEIDARHFDIACERIAAAQAQGRLFA